MTVVTWPGGRGKEDFPYAQYADSKYPLLQIAAANTGSASSYKVEWLPDLNGEPWVNFTQIVRTPFKPSPDPYIAERDKWRAHESHLQDVENILWHGVPSYERKGRGGYPLHTCGGALHYLGREPLQADTFSLRIMQDCVLLMDRGAVGQRVDEFLSEFSLEVRPAWPIKRGSNTPKLNAWAEGSSLA